jgi:hypothetical protein
MVSRSSAAACLCITLTSLASAANAAVVSIADATVTEGAPGNLTTISMTDPAGVFCQVAVTSSDGTAVEPADYSGFSGGFFNLNGVASDNLSIPVVDDDEVEGTETFTLTIALTANADPECQLGDATATITIVSNDAFAVVSIADTVVTEGGSPNQTTVSMTNPAGRFCQVAVTSSDGTAVQGADYSGFFGGFFNLNGVASDNLSIPVVDDGDLEGTETFTVSIELTASADSLCQLGDAVATILIVDNESGADLTPPTVTIDQAGPQVDPTSTSPILFTVVFSEPVIGFDAADVNLSASTTDATLTPSVSGGPTTFTVSVAAVGATVDGTVVATIPAGAASDGTNPSQASTSIDNTVILEADITPPSVTIDQAVLQADPTAVSPILFTVVFSEPVQDFDAADVDLSASTTDATLTPTVTGGPATFTVSVAAVGATVDGTVVATIAAAAASDGINFSLASTSTDNSVSLTVPVADIPVDDPLALALLAGVLLLAALSRIVKP